MYPSSYYIHISLFLGHLGSPTLGQYSNSSRFNYHDSKNM